ncbi:hypothetical protein POTOM_047518 [Populus tomentosa]|uniref:BHLH domain-containing protein n=1 Tax=Populus tomentosa TaxID=118781 RepID=A0A8X7YB51_POPTO|nr:hypothetical protein POTOM_047518 [Populus tomentosa]
MNMQTMGDFLDGEWDFSRLMFSMEEPDFTPELLGQCSFPQENDEGLQFTIPPAFFPPPEANVSMAGNESLFYSWNALSPNLHFDSQESETTCMNGDMSSDMIGDLDDNLQPAANTVLAKGFQLKRKLDVPESNTLDDMKKKPRITRNVQKSKKSVQSKKNQRSTPNISNDEEESNAGPDGQSSSSCSSEDDNASKDSDSKVSEAVSSSGKTRASRGAATDPQSLYARKRRERINERLKILQKIVPNGTKVDISTMLEEAVHYVKFLQLQIKLLSSDDLWMYAPLAYSGIDIGLDQKLSMLL